MNTLTYNGYYATVYFDSDDDIFVGHLAGINDIIGFHADTVADLRAAFREAVDDYIETCAKIGKSPERPYSGRIMVRVDPSVHQQAALAAQLTGKSLNQWTEDALRDAAARRLSALSSAALGDHDLAVFLGEALGLASHQRQHDFRRSAKLHAEGRRHDGPVHQDRVGEHGVEDSIFAAARIEKPQFRRRGSFFAKQGAGGRGHLRHEPVELGAGPAGLEVFDDHGRITRSPDHRHHVARRAAGGVVIDGDREVFAHSGLSSFNSQPNRSTAASAPTIWAAMKAGAEIGAIPAKVLDIDRAMVTAGFANDVDAVNQ